MAAQSVGMDEVSALICSGQLELACLNLAAPSRATKAQSVERRWQRFLVNVRIRVTAFICTLGACCFEWLGHRLYLALDTTALWDCYCMIHLSVICCGRAIPVMAGVEHGSATVAFRVPGCCENPGGCCAIIREISCC